jgi:mono/diheme cytochrome c family protein
MRIVLLTILGMLLLGAAVAVAVALTGAYNVSATEDHTPPVFWLLDTTMQNSVRNHAADIAAPGDLNEEERIQRGAKAYAQMCVICHLAPGKEPTDVHRGMHPQPPPLAEAAAQWQPNELFWIAKNGIKMSGMPAWGVTHSDEELWDVVAFLQQLPEMSEARYQELAFGIGG